MIGLLARFECVTYIFKRKFEKFNGSHMESELFMMGFFIVCRPI